MVTTEQILALIDRAFRDCARPEHFTNHTHCDECSEHDDLLRSRDRDTLSMEDVGNAGWDPIAFCTPEAFAYYLPALARLTLAARDPSDAWYGDQLLVHLERDGKRNDRWQRCTPEQRRAVAALLEHVFETQGDLISAGVFTEHQFFRTLEVWKDDGTEP
jgi:hypothetical protein